MKNILTGITFCVCLYVVYFIIKDNLPASKQQLEDVRKELKNEIDSVYKITKRIDTTVHHIKSKVNKISDDVDTLKVGQTIIYDNVKKTPKKFIDFFK